MLLEKLRQKKKKCNAVFLWCCKLLPLVSQVAGIKGMFLANRKLNNQVKTYITYNRGRDWRLLQAPSQDLKGNSIHCLLASVTQNAAFTPFFFLYMRVRPSKLSFENANDPRSRGNNVCQSALRRPL